MKPTDQQTKGTERRRYEKPKLQDHGRLAELTRNTSTNPNNMGDGGMAGATKT